jgi:hypothetical protein
MPVKYIANNNLTNQYGMLGGGPHYSGGVYSGGAYSGGAYLQGDSPYGMMVSPYYGGSNYKDVRYTGGSYSGGVHYSGGEYSGGGDGSEYYGGAYEEFSQKRVIKFLKEKFPQYANDAFIRKNISYSKPQVLAKVISEIGLTTEYIDWYNSLPPPILPIIEEPKLTLQQELSLKKQNKPKKTEKGKLNTTTGEWEFNDDVEREFDLIKQGAGNIYSLLKPGTEKDRLMESLGNYLSAIERGVFDNALPTSKNETKESMKIKLIDKAKLSILSSLVSVWNSQYINFEDKYIYMNPANFNFSADDTELKKLITSKYTAETPLNIPPSPAPSTSSSLSGFSIYDLKSPPPSMPSTPQISNKPYSLPNPPPSGNMAPSSISNTQNIGESADKLSKDIGFINSNLPISTTQEALLSQKMADEDAIVHNFVESKNEQDNKEEFGLDDQLPPLPQEISQETEIDLINKELNSQFEKLNWNITADNVETFFTAIEQGAVYDDLMSRPFNEAVKAFLTLLSPVRKIIYSGEATDDVSLKTITQMLNDYRVYNKNYTPPTIKELKEILAEPLPEEQAPELAPPIEQKYGDLPPAPIDYTDRQYELPLTEEELTPLEMIPFEDVSQPVDRQQAQNNNINAINEPVAYSNQIANAMRGVGSLASRMFFGQPRTPEQQASMRQQQTAREATAPIEQRLATAIDQQNKQVAPIEQQLANAIDQQNRQVAPIVNVNVAAPDVRQIEIQTGKLQDIINSLAQAIIDNNENNTKFTKQVQIEMLKSLETFGTKATKDLSLLFSPVPTIVSNAIKNLPASIRNDPQTLQSLTEVVKMTTGYRGIDDKPIPVPPRIQLTASKELTEQRSGIPGWYKSNFKLERAPSRLLQPEEFKYIYRIATR